MIFLYTYLFCAFVTVSVEFLIPGPRASWTLTGRLIRGLCTAAGLMPWIIFGMKGQVMVGFLVTSVNVIGCMYVFDKIAGDRFVINTGDPQ